MSPNLLWNIHNTPASQISMLGRITGMTFAPVAACATFGVALKLAMDAIRRGEAKAVVVGAADPPPHPLTVGGFYGARVISADAQVSKPLSELRGTHVAGGRGDLDRRRPRAHDRPRASGRWASNRWRWASRPTPTTSSRRPSTARWRRSTTPWPPPACAPDEIGSWDLHATATPGDFLEVETLRETFPEACWSPRARGLSATAWARPAAGS